MLADPAHWPDAAVPLLANLGFRLLEPVHAESDHGHLLIALRDRPTLRHFDPEVVTYYAPAPGGAAPATIDRRISTGPTRGERPALWGQVRVIDRVPVTNRFLTFGGDLRFAVVHPGLTILDLWSPAPIVRWGGHSQGTDPLTAAIGAFFGRLMVPVDFVAGAAEKIDTLLPEALYLAFLMDTKARAIRMRKRGAGETQLDFWLAAALARARSDTIACGAAERLLAELDL